MIIYNVITAICLGLLIIQGLYMIINAFGKKRPDRIAFIRGFKNGKCALIYITAIPLYLIGHIYSGKDMLDAFFLAVNKIVNLVVLKYDITSIEQLMKDNYFYYITIYLAFITVGLNAVLFALSFTTQQCWCFIGWLKRALTPNERLIIFGNNKASVDIYKSDKSRNKHIVDNLSAKEMEALYQEDIYYSSCKLPDERIDWIFKSIERTGKKHKVIVNTECDDKSIRICRKLINAMNEFDGDKDTLFLKINIYVFGDPKYQAIYDDIVASGYGCIKYVNKYQIVAMDFISKYPLALFMDERQLDYNTALVKDDVEINVAFVGFGKTNRQILLTSVANNQFLKKGKGEPELKKVNYYIYDRDNAKNDKNLNHSYYRYKDECAGLNEDEYLPIPTLPANEEYFQMDINDGEFYHHLKELFTRSKNDVNFLIIGYGTDLENIDLAQKLVEKRQDWGLDNLIIFVKARAYLKEETLLNEDRCYFIGNERAVVYDVEKIISDDIEKMAKMRNEVYDLEYAITNEGLIPTEESVKANEADSISRWHKQKTEQERESSIYACLSIRSKLNLMGLDYIKGDSKDKDALSEEEYLRIYAKGDEIDLKTYAYVNANGKPIINYTLDFKDTLRKTLAIHEHQRWNSFMISKGTVPSNLYQIYADHNGRKFTNGKSYRERRHGNLTTFEGLVEFRRLLANRKEIIMKKKQMIAQQEKIDIKEVVIDERAEIEASLENEAYKKFLNMPSRYEQEFDVIKYDYQLLDDAFWLLNKNGYKIIQKRG